MIKYEIHPERIIMIALPMNINIDPIPEIIVNLATFLTIKQKVAQAAGQKLLLVNAI
jgi:hypothetical protein